MHEPVRRDHDPAMPRRARPPQPEQHHLPRAPARRRPHQNRSAASSKPAASPRHPARYGGTVHGSSPYSVAPHPAHQPQAIAPRAQHRRLVPIRRAEPARAAATIRSLIANSARPSSWSPASRTAQHEVVARDVRKAAKVHGVGELRPARREPPVAPGGHRQLVARDRPSRPPARSNASISSPPIRAWLTTRSRNPLAPPVAPRRAPETEPAAVEPAEPVDRHPMPVPHLRHRHRRRETPDRRDPPRTAHRPPRVAQRLSTAAPSARSAHAAPTAARRETPHPRARSRRSSRAAPDAAAPTSRQFTRQVSTAAPS